jgi:hypothetical protein
MSRCGRRSAVFGPVVFRTVLSIRVGRKVYNGSVRLSRRAPWSYGAGFGFWDLTPGVEMTLRVSAPGYADEEQTVRPASGPQTAMLFTPRPLVSVVRD